MSLFNQGSNQHLGFHVAVAVAWTGYWTYRSALRILRLVSWIPYLLLINHTTLDFRRCDDDASATKIRGPQRFLSSATVGLSLAGRAE